MHIDEALAMGYNVVIDPSEAQYLAVSPQELFIKKRPITLGGDTSEFELELENSIRGCLEDATSYPEEEIWLYKLIKVFKREKSNKTGQPEIIYIKEKNDE